MRLAAWSGIISSAPIWRPALRALVADGEEAGLTVASLTFLSKSSSSEHPDT